MRTQIEIINNCWTELDSINYILIDLSDLEETDDDYKEELYKLLFTLSGKAAKLTETFNELILVKEKRDNGRKKTN